MTIAQIMAVLSLLLAFGVEQPTVKQVEVILTAQQSVTIRTMEEKPKVEEVVEAKVVEETPVKRWSKYSDTPVVTEATKGVVQ